LAAEYTTEPALYGNLISQNRQGVESQNHFDAVGSTLGLTDDGQQITDTSAYTAFGEVSEHTGSTVNPFKYVGRKEYFRDELTSDYLTRRWCFDPKKGRWLSRTWPDHLTILGYSSVTPGRPAIAFQALFVAASLAPDPGEVSSRISLSSRSSSPTLPGLPSPGREGHGRRNPRTVYVQERRRMPFEDAAIPFHEIVPPEMRDFIRRLPQRWADEAVYSLCKNECDVLYVWYANKVCGPQWANCDRACPTLPRPIWGWCAVLIGFGVAAVPCIVGWRTKQDCRDDCQMAFENCLRLAFQASEKCRDEIGVPRKEPQEHETE
jgi:hypothetical protein